MIMPFDYTNCYWTDKKWLCYKLHFQFKSLLTKNEVSLC
jgi:hypothetical protein